MNFSDCFSLSPLGLYEWWANAICSWMLRWPVHAHNALQDCSCVLGMNQVVSWHRFWPLERDQMGYSAGLGIEWDTLQIFKWAWVQDLEFKRHWLKNVKLNLGVGFLLLQLSLPSCCDIKNGNLVLYTEAEKSRIYTRSLVLSVHS